ncbi:Putative aminoglycoside phosphotransferase [bacterium HR30]|nr:Putative aminoglycoside phosphotransferase [bacterium HR30]
MEQAEFANRVSSYIAEKTGAPRVDVLRLERLPGGASRETWGVEVRIATNGEQKSQSLILRRDPPGLHLPGQRWQEFELLRLAHEAGVPVPRVYWCESDPSYLGAAFLIMERVEGETIPRRLLRDEAYREARRALPQQLARALAAIHAMNWRGTPLEQLPMPPENQPASLFELDRFEQLYRGLSPDPHPVFELAFRWLRHHAEREERRTLVHGDFRLGNVICGPEGLRAVLDWELAHVGDPLEDIGWLCVRSWRFGHDDLPVGGLAKREEFYTAYEEASGWKIDRRRARYWELLGNLKWGVITILQLRGYLDGDGTNVERASLGRRTAEVELELLCGMKGEYS